MVVRVHDVAVELGLEPLDYIRVRSRKVCLLPRILQKIEEAGGLVARKLCVNNGPVRGVIMRRGGVDQELVLRLPHDGTRGDWQELSRARGIFPHQKRPDVQAIDVMRAPRRVGRIHSNKRQECWVPISNMYERT